MKLTPEQQRTIERMGPGILCRDGFLGSDARPLPEILRADEAAVRKLRITHEQIAQALGQVLRQAAARMGAPVAVGQALTARYCESMGRIACPWGGCGVFAKGEVELRHAPTGQTLRLTPLSVHLVEHHGFYQGRGSRYRLEPGQIVEWLDIHPAAG